MDRETLRLLELLNQLRLTEEQKDQVRAFAGKCREKNYAKKSGFFKRIFEKFNLNGED